MKLISLELHNFRQYYGVQKIEFSHDDDQNTTILFGENGKGKTGIYRAIMFALFGDRHISQDNKNEDVHLVNFKYLDEMTPSPVESKVVVEFEHDSVYHILSRSIHGNKHNDRISEKTGSILLRYKDPDGNIEPESITSVTEIATTISKIMDEEIKDFFLFDGEKIDTLTKTSSDVRKEVREAILNLLQLDNLEDARSFITSEKTIIERKLIREVNNAELNKYKLDLEKIENDIDEQNEKYRNFEIEREEIDETIATHQITLENNREILNLKNEKEENLSKIEDNKSTINNIRENLISNNLKSAPYLLMNNTFNDQAITLNNLLGENKIEVPLNILEKSFHDSHCVICNNNLQNDELSQQHVISLIESHNHSDTYGLARSLLTMMENKMPIYSDKEEEFNANLKRYKEVKKNIYRLEDTISKLDKDIGELAKSDINLAEVEENIRNEKDKKDKVDRKYYNAESRISELRSEYRDLKERIDEIYRMKNQNESEQRKMDLLGDLESTLKLVEKEFKEDVRELLGNETTNIFKELIDNKDINMIEEIEINGKFEIKALNTNGYNILPDISQGQRQILSLAFITALAKVAVDDADNEMIDYPLFMDSPFNRLSGVNRDHLIEKIPRLTSQWILLLTDTELTPSEERIFKAHNTLGKWYRINQIDISHSELEEVDINESMATRGGY